MRQLTPLERGVLEFLLSEDFPGADALRAQAELAVVTRDLGPDAPVLFAVPDSAPRAEVEHAVPVETQIKDRDPPVEILLFVRDGVLDSLEIVTYDDTRVDELPQVAALAPPRPNTVA